MVFVWLLSTPTVVSFISIGRELNSHLLFPQLLPGTPSHRYLHNDGDEDHDGYCDHDGHDDAGSFLVRDRRAFPNLTCVDHDYPHYGHFDGHGSQDDDGCEHSYRFRDVNDGRTYHACLGLYRDNR